jgi:hypothetical protein
MEWVVVECCGVSCRRICICPHHSTLKAHCCDGDYVYKTKDSKFLMDANSLCSCPIPVCEKWRINGAVNLASLIFARQRWIFNWI